MIKEFEGLVNNEVKESEEKCNDVGLVKEVDLDMIGEEDKEVENNVDIEVEGDIFGEEEI